VASIYRHGRGWRAQVCVNNVRDSETFRTRQEASRWALEAEERLARGGASRLPFAAVMERYAAEVSPRKRGARWELLRLRALARWPMAEIPMDKLGAADLSAWRDARLGQVKPATVARELNLIRSVLEKARRDWELIRVNPLADVMTPASPKGRKRRVTQDEIDRIALGLGVGDKLRGKTATQRTGLAFLFAIETGMRSKEILGLTWGEIRDKSVHLPLTKNSDERDVPLSPRAREILAVLPRGAPTAFAVDGRTRDVFFRRARDDAGLRTLRFHDSRSEAIWRLSKKLDILDLARVIGHRDLKSLMIYYNADADELADRL
jgi:integrase